MAMGNESDRLPTDEMLVARCQQGDFEAFAEVYRRYRRPVIAYINQITRNYDDAACIAQDVFLSVFEHVGRFDTERRFSTWLFAIARNAAIDYLQTRYRKTMVDVANLDQDNNPAAMAFDGAASISETLARTESNHLLAEAIAKLPQMHREIIELVVFQDRSYEEASAILNGVSPNTLRSRMFHALRRLRGLLQQVGGKQGNELI
jgi:RNA polymerase sigma-70 factor (ECF subfamily)